MKNDTQALRKCTECGNTYTPKHKNNIYCSGKCADKVYNRKRRAKAAEAAREWRKNNAERAHAAAKAYRKANREAETARVRRWLKTPRGKETSARSNRTWKLNNPDRVTSYVLRRMKAEKEGGATAELIEEMWNNGDKTCYLCGIAIDTTTHFLAPTSRTIDHIMPISRGGKHDLDNLAFACRKCNLRKGNKTLEEYRAYLARHQQDA